MRKSILLVLLLILAADAETRGADVAVVKSTFTTKKRPSSAKSVKTYCGIIESGLKQGGVPYEVITEEQVVAGELAQYKLAIFPFNCVFQDDAMAQIKAFVQGGGKLVWFYTVHPSLQDILGLAKCGYRGKNYEGEFHTMKFVDDCPPGFPASVHQESPNSRIVEQLADGARAIAVWHDKDGKSTGVPAVVLSPHGLFVSHVFWSAADTAEQRHLLLATVGHFIPGKWDEIVNGMLAKAAPAAGFDDLDRLCSAAQKTETAREWAEKTRAQVRQARELLAAEKFSEAMTLAKEAQNSAQKTAAAVFPSRPYELRGAWMHPREGTDWEAIMSELEAANFNAVFPLMCGPESASYPSDVLPQRTETDFMKACLEAARRHGIEVHVWRANWQVLHRGNDRHKQFMDEGRMVLSLEQAKGEKEKSHYQWSTRWLDPSDDRNRELEFKAMIELVEKYHPDGIHFDFMRYPQSNYCYCDRCRTKFEEWSGVKVETWPDDCYGKGARANAYRDWRRHLQTSLVKRIAERAREIDPNVKISIAARSSMRGSFDSDAQDWVTWAKQDYLDMLCPMDYTGSVDVLRRKLTPQVAAIDGAVPVYAGIGVSPSRSASPVNLSQQIVLARELGADGFLVFALSAFSRAMLPTVHLGATSTPVDVMPHHKQGAKATFTYPLGIPGGPARVYAAGKGATVRVRIAATSTEAASLSVQAFVLPAAGGPAEAATEPRTGKGGARSFGVPVPQEPGIYSIIIRGEAVLKSGKKEPFYLRSRPVTVLSEQQKQELAEQLQAGK